MSSFDDFIEHYGVKGQKWGVRKKRSSTSRTKFAKAPSRLTDSELKSRIQRLEAERKYNELNRRTVSTGERLVSDVLTNSGRRIATTVVTNAGMLAVGAAIASRFGEGTGSAVIKKLK